MVQICGITTANFNYPLTTWPRSLSMLCRRASLCPAETQEDKHQQTTKRSPQGRRYLQSWNATRVPTNASLRSWFMPWTASERPRLSLYTEHQRFMTQLLATRLKHNTKTVFTSSRFTVWAYKQSSPPSLWSLLAYTPHTEVNRENERCADEASIFPVPLLSLAMKGEGCAGRVKREKKKCQEEKLFYSKSYPFHAFQIALQQRVQSKDHIVAEALEL